MSFSTRICQCPVFQLNRVIVMTVQISLMSNTFFGVTFYLTFVLKYILTIYTNLLIQVVIDIFQTICVQFQSDRMLMSQELLIC